MAPMCVCVCILLKRILVQGVEVWHCLLSTFSGGHTFISAGSAGPVEALVGQ
jgi:hypothetical protein